MHPNLIFVKKKFDEDFVFVKKIFRNKFDKCTLILVKLC